MVNLTPGGEIMTEILNILYEVFGETLAYVLILAAMIILGGVGLLFEAISAFIIRRKS